jgi:predicted PurR-regulated permease PerM
MGIAGAILAVPVAAAVQIVIREVLASRHTRGGHGAPGAPSGP